MEPIRVLVVDDSAVIRRLVSTVLEADPGVTVVGVAANGRIALEMLRELDVDLVTLDIEMPVMDGLETLREIRRFRTRLPVIMFSTLTENGAAATLDALASGASDYVTKPSNVGSFEKGLAAIREQLLPRVKALAGRRALVHAASRRTPVPPVSTVATPAAPVAARRAKTPAVLAIGCSTGGPDALARLLPQLPADFPLPIVIVQHMPPVFTALFAARLDKSCAISVKEAEHGDRLQPGTALLAPGDFHMVVQARADAHRVALTQEAQEHFCRPAVDPLFRSVAHLYGSHVLAVILTGMGADGRDGSRAVAEAGGTVIAQDEATSVVWGMPGSVVNAGLAHAVLPLDALGTEIITRTSTRSGVAS
jgi:two-component system, chemotaxis family, protein-glutamate methylesterase/glutaminase